MSFEIRDLMVKLSPDTGEPCEGEGEGEGENIRTCDLCETTQTVKAPYPHGDPDPLQPVSVGCCTGTQTTSEPKKAGFEPAPGLALLRRQLQQTLSQAAG